MAVNNFNYAVPWSDFNQVSSRPPNEDEDAGIHTRMNLSYQLGGKGKATIVSKADVNVLMVTQDCWVVSSKMTSRLLGHEQGHYDIQALVAREFHDKVIELSAPSDDKLKAKIRELELKYNQITAVVNQRYDDATAHSTNTAVQQDWDLKIDAAKINPRGTVNDLP